MLVSFGFLATGGDSRRCTSLEEPRNRLPEGGNAFAERPERNGQYVERPRPDVTVCDRLNRNSVNAERPHCARLIPVGGPLHHVQAPRVRELRPVAACAG